MSSSWGDLRSRPTALENRIDHSRRQSVGVRLQHGCTVPSPGSALVGGLRDWIAASGNSLGSGAWLLEADDQREGAATAADHGRGPRPSAPMAGAAFRADPATRPAPPGHPHRLLRSWHAERPPAHRCPHRGSGHRKSGDRAQQRQRFQPLCRAALDQSPRRHPEASAVASPHADHPLRRPGQNLSHRHVDFLGATLGITCPQRTGALGNSRDLGRWRGRVRCMPVLSVSP